MTGGGLTEREARRRLYGLDPSAFEEVVAQLWRANGWDARTTPSGADRGVDVVATRGAQKVLIQAKRYGPDNKVSGPEVQQYGSLFLQENADAVFVVTTSRFTEQARRRAQEVGVTLVNGDGVAQAVAEVASPSEDVDGENGTTEDVDDGDGRPLDADEMTVGAAAGTSPHETVGETSAPVPRLAAEAPLTLGGFAVAAATVVLTDPITATSLGIGAFLLAYVPSSRPVKQTLLLISAILVVGGILTLS